MTTLFVEFAGRRIPCRLEKRPPGEKPRERLAWRDGWVSFQAGVVIVWRIWDGAAKELELNLRKIGYTQVRLEEETPVAPPRARRTRK